MKRERIALAVVSVTAVVLLGCTVATYFVLFLRPDWQSLFKPSRGKAEV
jgi:hypothetical protein